MLLSLNFWHAMGAQYMLHEQNVGTEPPPGYSCCYGSLPAPPLPRACSLQPGHSSVCAEPTGFLYPPPQSPSPLGVETLVLARGHHQQGWDSDSPLHWKEGTGPALPQQPTEASSFSWLNVCFQIPEACVTPTPVPAGPWPGPLLLPSSSCLARLVCRVGCQAKSLCPAAPQLGSAL